jgi:hypothetical protein
VKKPEVFRRCGDLPFKSPSSPEVALNNETYLLNVLLYGNDYNKNSTTTSHLPLMKTLTRKISIFRIDLLTQQVDDVALVRVSPLVCRLLHSSIYNINIIHKRLVGQLWIMLIAVTTDVRLSCQLSCQLLIYCHIIKKVLTNVMHSCCHNSLFLRN